MPDRIPVTSAPRRPVVRLEDPLSPQLEAAFRTLPDLGCLDLGCRRSRLQTILRQLEECGFQAIQLNVLALHGPHLSIRAVKPPSGPCLDTGRLARYTGQALAALDDGQHLLCGALPVCEKTAALYALPCYADWITLSPPDPALAAKLSTHPRPFACESYEPLASALAQELAAQPAPHGPASTAILYPGPFRLLLLKDGSLLERGRPTLVPQPIGRELLDSGEAFPWHPSSHLPHDPPEPPPPAPQTTTEAAPPEPESPLPARSYTQEFAAKGALCLGRQGPLTLAPPGSKARDPEAAPDWSALTDAPTELKDRLRQTIATHSPYLILSGTDPREPAGCCPSELLGAALRLVEAGILEAQQRPTPALDCPVTVLAFPGEITGEPSQPAFQLNHPFRARVQEALAKSIPARTLARRVATAVLAAFTLTSLALALIEPTTPGVPGPADPAEVLALPQQELVLLVLFRGSARCRFCEQLDAFARSSLERHFARELANGTVAYREIDTDRPENHPFRGTYGLYTATLVLFRIHQGQTTRWQVLEEAWRLTENESAFSDLLRKKIGEFQPPSSSRTQSAGTSDK